MNTKKLFIVRHAKAEEHSFATNDYKRNLIERGELRATKIARLLKDTITINSQTLFVSSSANRAIQTAELFCSELDYPISSIIQTKEIYEADYKTILKIINQIPNHIETVVIFGHNPGLSDLTNYICNSYITLKTSAVAAITLEKDLNFSELSGNTAYLDKIFTE